jgi:hypothetical protein
MRSVELRTHLREDSGKCTDWMQGRRLDRTEGYRVALSVEGGNGSVDEWPDNNIKEIPVNDVLLDAGKERESGTRGLLQITASLKLGVRSFLKLNRA